MPFIALVIIVVLLAGVPGTAVLADQAKPGDALFGIDQTLENARLRLAASTESKAKLKVRFAQERADELSAIDKSDETVLGEAVEELDEAIHEADESVDELKVEVKVKRTSSLSADQLQAIVDSLLALLRNVDTSLDSIKIEVKNEEIKIEIKELEDEIDEELEADEERDIELDGTLLRAGSEFTLYTAEGTFVLVSQIDFSPFIGKAVEVEGEMSDSTLTVRELKLEGIKIKAEGGVTKAKLEGTLAKSGGTFQMTIQGITFTLAGPLAVGSLLDNAIGRQVEVRGVLDGTTLTLTRLESEDEDEGIEIRAETEEADEEEDGDGSDVSIEVETNDEKTRIEGQKIELKGTLTESTGKFSITVGGVTYTVTGTGLSSYVGKKVEIHGTLSGSTVTVTEIQADSSGNGGGGSSGSGDEGDND